MVSPRYFTRKTIRECGEEMEYVAGHFDSLCVSKLFRKYFKKIRNPNSLISTIWTLFKYDYVPFRSKDTLILVIVIIKIVIGIQATSDYYDGRKLFSTKFRDLTVKTESIFDPINFIQVLPVTIYEIIKCTMILIKDSLLH